MRKLLFVVPLLAAFLVATALGCKSEPPVGPGKVVITETTTSTTTVATTTMPKETVSLFAFSPQTPEACQVVNFDGSLSTPGTARTIVAYSWDFGDGEKKTGVKSTHDYVISGVYLVTLVVTDDSGATARSSQPVTVRPSTSPCPTK
jgi:large repetitive protein